MTRHSQLRNHGPDRCVLHAEHGPTAAIDAKDTRPVFIVGMPRPGTSPVEQIFPRIPPRCTGLAKLEDLLAIASRVGGPHGLQSIRTRSEGSPRRSWTHWPAAISVGSHRSIRDAATSPTRCRSTTSNWAHRGSVPGRRVIHCLRDRMDTCLSCYMNDIAAGVTFARDQKTLAGYFRQYERLMKHWEGRAEPPDAGGGVRRGCKRSRRSDWP